MCYEVNGDSNTKVIAIKALKRKVIYGEGGKFGVTMPKTASKLKTAK
jgi:hypothetical protein